MLERRARINMEVFNSYVWEECNDFPWHWRVFLMKVRPESRLKLFRRNESDQQLDALENLLDLRLNDDALPQCPAPTSFYFSTAIPL
jgi:hypothetical protein